MGRKLIGKGINVMLQPSAGQQTGEKRERNPATPVFKTPEGVSINNSARCRRSRNAP
jgi:hypothetical protein